MNICVHTHLLNTFMITVCYIIATRLTDMGNLSRIYRTLQSRATIRPETVRISGVIATAALRRCVCVKSEVDAYLSRELSRCSWMNRDIRRFTQDHFCVHIFIHRIYTYLYIVLLFTRQMYVLHYGITLLFFKH